VTGKVPWQYCEASTRKECGLAAGHEAGAAAPGPRRQQNLPGEESFGVRQQSKTVTAGLPRPRRRLRRRLLRG
jgi:hypothetical protein